MYGDKFCKYRGVNVKVSIFVVCETKIFSACFAFTFSLNYKGTFEGRHISANKNKPFSAITCLLFKTIYVHNNYKNNKP